MTWTGRRGWRRGEQPHCRRCDYLLVGITSGRCPECGTQLDPKSVVHGERVRRPRVMAAGLLVLAIGLAGLSGMGFNWGRSFDWYRLAPTGWLLREVKPGWPSLRAWQELARREAAGKISGAQRTEMADDALAFQAARRPGQPQQEMVEWLALASLNGRIIESQKRQWLAQLVRPAIEVRPKVGERDQVPWKIAYDAGVFPGSLCWVHASTAQLALDGKPISGGEGQVNLNGSGISSYGSAFPCGQLGEHVITATARVQVFRGVNVSVPGQPLLDQRDVKLSATFHVVPKSEAHTVKVIDDPALSAAVQKSIHVGRFTLDTSRNELKGSIDVSNAPGPLCMEVLVRYDGKERPLGMLLVKRGEGMGASYASIVPPMKQFDLVLRSSAKAARQTVDVYEIWGGELTFTRLEAVQKP